MIHLSPSDLDALLSGEMPSELAEAAAWHLDSCAECRELAEQHTEVPRDIWAALVVATDHPGRIERPAAPEFPGYRILEELGRGGCGVVYRAEEETTGRIVALKVLRAGAMASPSEQEWFLGEARSAARLNHPNIVVVLSVSEALGLPYYVMEFLPAGSLADRLDGTPLTPADSARLLESIARATHHAHEAGVIHRDLKPGNILLDFSSEAGEMFRPKLSDFGMAKRHEAGNATPTQAILGTPSYMSPEQAFGNSRDVGPTSDVYSLGAILYEVLTGRPPFKGGTPYETLLLTRDEDPVPPRSLRPGIPRDLDTICLKCLEKDPQRRYPSAQSLANDLRAFLDGKPVTARAISSAERLARLARRHPITAAIAVLAILLTLSAMTVVTVFWRHAEAQRAQLVEANQKAKERDDKLLKALVFSADATSRFFQNPTLASKLDRRAIIEQLKVFEEVPELTDSPEQEHRFAYALLQIGNALAILGEQSHADRIVAKASNTLGRLALSHPDKLSYLYHYSESCIELAGRVAERGRVEEAIRHQEEAVRIGEQLAARDPENDAYPANLANYRISLSLSYKKVGRLVDGETQARLGYQENQRLVRLYPHDPARYRFYNTSSLAYRSFLIGKPDKVDILWDLARERMELCEQARVHPDWPLMAENLLPIEFAVDLRKGGRQAELRQYEDYSIRVWRELIGRGQPSARNRRFLLEWLTLSAFESWSEDPTRASSLFREALSRLEERARSADAQGFLPDLIHLLIFCPDPAVKNPSRALSFARELSRDQPEQRLNLGICLAETGDYLAARNELEAYLVATNLDPNRLETLAARFYHSVVLEHLGEHERAEHERSSAMAQLSRANFQPHAYKHILQHLKWNLPPSN